MDKTDSSNSALYGVITPYKELHDMLDNGIETFTLFPLICPRNLIQELKLTDESLVCALLNVTLRFFIDDGEHSNEERFQEELEYRLRAY